MPVVDPLVSDAEVRAIRERIRSIGRRIRYLERFAHRPEAQAVRRVLETNVMILERLLRFRFVERTEEGRQMFDDIWNRYIAMEEAIFVDPRARG